MQENECRYNRIRDFLKTVKFTDIYALLEEGNKYPLISPIDMKRALWQLVGDGEVLIDNQMHISLRTQTHD